MRIDLTQTAALLHGAQSILFLTHANPDGDTLGAAYALALALQGLGKQCAVRCPEEIPAPYAFMQEALPIQAFTPQLIVAADIAVPELLGNLRQEYEGKIDLCIDHHPSNGLYAAQTLLYPEAAAACEAVYDVLNALEAPITPVIAGCLYAGISTDTGCFRYASTTAQTHRITAQLMDLGADTPTLNRRFFETKRLSALQLERLVVGSLQMHCGGRCAMMCITQEMLRESGAVPAQTEGLSGLPREIEGVLVGAMLKEQPGGEYRVSLRTHAPLDACAICAVFGGGGHARAAGCTIRESAETTQELLLAAITDALRQVES